MYPAPHFSPLELDRAENDARAGGFLADPWLDRLTTPVFGLNVAIHWPLPPVFRERYDRFARAFAALDDALYVYPFEQTHVTLATLVSFKRHDSATARTRVEALLPAIAQGVDAAAEGLVSFDVDVGAPVLVRPAAFLPILDPGGQITRLRQRLTPLRALDELAGLQIPGAIHSTVGRFRSAPRDPAGLIAAFREIAQTASLGVAPVREILVTTETRPYMCDGAIVHRVRLPEL